MQKWEEDLKDGFQMTGDVMEQRGPNIVIWIDRKKNIMKLSQGEFVSTSRLEATYAGRHPSPCHCTGSVKHPGLSLTSWTST